MIVSSLHGHSFIATVLFIYLYLLICSSQMPLEGWKIGGPEHKRERKKELKKKSGERKKNKKLSGLLV